MKRRIWPVICVTILVFFLGSFPALCDDIQKNSQLKQYYENFIDEMISKCQSKAQLTESKSTHLRNFAFKETKKANYFIANKEMLINEMIVNDIGIKQYKMEYFLNTKFFENNGILQGKKL